MLRVSEDVELRIGGKPHRFEHVEHERCEACGERIFGLEASRRFDSLVVGGAKYGR